MKTFLHWLFLEKASFGAFGFTISGCPAFILLLTIVWWFSCEWVSFDAARRGKSARVGFWFAMLAGWPLSLLWWRWLRPPQVVKSFLEPASHPVGRNEVNDHA
jgi:hypothetical protein